MRVCIGSYFDSLWLSCDLYNLLHKLLAQISLNYIKGTSLLKQLPLKWRWLSASMQHMSPCCCSYQAVQTRLTSLGHPPRTFHGSVQKECSMRRWLSNVITTICSASKSSERISRYLELSLRLKPSSSLPSYPPPVFKTAELHGLCPPVHMALGQGRRNNNRRIKQSIKWSQKLIFPVTFAWKPPRIQSGVLQW